MWAKGRMFLVCPKKYNVAKCKKGPRECYIFATSDTHSGTELIVFWDLWWCMITQFNNNIKYSKKMCNVRQEIGLCFAGILCRFWTEVRRNCNVFRIDFFLEDKQQQWIRSDFSFRVSCSWLAFTDIKVIIPLFGRS